MMFINFEDFLTITIFMKLVDSFKKHRVLILTLIPFLFFITVLSIAKLSENKALIKCQSSIQESSGSCNIVVNEVKGDYLYCDINLSCPRGKYKLHNIFKYD